MKRVLMRLALSVFTLAGTLLMAQMSPEIIVNFKQPVHVNSTTLPAGEYTIKIHNVGGGDTPMLIIQSPKASVMALATRHPAVASEAGRTHVVLELRDGVHNLDKLTVGATTFELQ